MLHKQRSSISLALVVVGVIITVIALLINVTFVKKPSDEAIEVANKLKNEQPTMNDLLGEYEKCYTFSYGEVILNHFNNVGSCGKLYDIKSYYISPRCKAIKNNNIYMLYCPYAVLYIDCGYGLGGTPVHIRNIYIYCSNKTIAKYSISFSSDFSNPIDYDPKNPCKTINEINDFCSSP